MVVFVSFPIAFGIISVAPTFVPAVLGQEWTPMILPLQLLAVYGLLNSINAPMEQIWKASGNPNYATKVSGLRVVATAVLIYPATQYAGIVGTSAVIVVAYLCLALPYGLYKTGTVIDLSYRNLASELAYPITAGGLMLGAVVVVRESISFQPKVLELSLLVLAGACVYLTLVILFTNLLDWRVAEDIEQIVNDVTG